MPIANSLPEGTPIEVGIPFGAIEALDVQIGTKAESSYADESRIHDLYVMLFNNDDNGNKFYGHYFTYEHLQLSLKTLNNQSNEGWYVKNVPAGTTDTTVKTYGVVKISTQKRSNCTLVVLANISNTVTGLDGKDALERLGEIQDLATLQALRVDLQQDVVNRNDLFLMMGQLNVNTGDLHWGEWDNDLDEPVFNKPGGNYQVQLKRLDAKIKFRVKYNETNISSITPRNWTVYNVPSSCYLFDQGENPARMQYFTSAESYFEGTETDTDGTWEVFCFYMLENRQLCKSSINGLTPEQVAATKVFNNRRYYLREKQIKSSTGKNEGWEYAPDDGTYVQFDMVLNLTTSGINAIDSGRGGLALTSEAKFTVHLGDFTSSEENSGYNYDDYNTLRNHAYTYNITVNNSNSIYVEVYQLDEPQPGQEGSLLFATDEIFQCDAHYGYHSMMFTYNAHLVDGSGISKLTWKVKSPFGGGEANWNGTGWDTPTGNDWKWVKFCVNGTDGGHYSPIRKSYPGDDMYDPDWDPTKTPYSNPTSAQSAIIDSRYSGTYPFDYPELMDINQLVQYIYRQTEKEYSSAGSSDFKTETIDGTTAGRIRVTAFVDEYYYEKEPGKEDGPVNPDLWREFVNKVPRELHILSDDKLSQDGMSDVVESTHSIIQQSIQTIYNTFSPDLSSLWGIEHWDEMYEKTPVDNPDPNETKHVHTGWFWWENSAGAGDGPTLPTTLAKDDENGRYNSAVLWGLYPEPATPLTWNTFLNFATENEALEMEGEYQKMAFSCMARNRDNNGNGFIDQDELRWYLTSVNQLVGLWVGNEALSVTARLYQPVKKHSTNRLEFRAHVASSTCHSSNRDPLMVRAEEGISKSSYLNDYHYVFPESVGGLTAAIKVASVRCARNIGTFQDQDHGGAVTDITHAPYTRMVDQYYEIPAGTDDNNKVWPNDDGTYTIRFSRLNTKSLREYSAEDLPFHDENSNQNKVYIEMTAQNPADRPADYPDGMPGLNTVEINNTITEGVHNVYCPDGYRLPNMTELALMSALLPASYFSGGFNFPCRTFFSLGFFGDDTETISQGEVPRGPKSKTSWAYSNKYHLLYYSENTIRGIRCVRDHNLTGTITGQLRVSEDRLNVPTVLHPDDGRTTISFNFTSQASAFTDVTLALCYRDSDGVAREDFIPIPESLSLHGITFMGTMDYQLDPGLTSRGKMTLKVTLKNAANQEKSFIVPIKVLSDVSTTLKLLPCRYETNQKNNPPFPVSVSAISNNEPITAMRLRVLPPEADEEEVFNLMGSGSSTNWTINDNTEKIGVYDYTNYYINDTAAGNLLRTGTYTFQLEAECDGKVTRSDEVTMEVLKVEYAPNPDTESAIQASDITGLWERQRINDLNFAAGDFIEANMDVSKCVYKYYDGSKENNIGLDDLISFGVNDIGWVPWTLHVYYPAVADPSQNPPTGDHYLRFNGYRSSDSKGVNYCVIDNSKPLHIRLDWDGVHWNNQKVNTDGWPQLSDTHNKLRSSNSLYVGSIEGVHHSRAVYHFVRVTHNSSDSDSLNKESNFGNNPQYGNL